MNKLIQLSKLESIEFECENVTKGPFSVFPLITSYAFLT